MTRTSVRVGRVYDPAGDGEEVRVLVDRLWPRGLSKAGAALDERCKQVAPSPQLRRWYGHDPARFTEFRRRYRTELVDPERAAALTHLRDLARGRAMVLLTAAKDVTISHAAVLAELLADDHP
jgi:uncharacterized protein YeaO (DUF488 family)